MRTNRYEFMAQKYPRTDDGRRRFIEDSLRESESGAKDCTPAWVELMIIVVISPLLIPVAVYAGGKWLILKLLNHDHK